MGELSRQSGVPSSTIKHYLREGLLPGKSVSIARNSALYDRALVDQIRHIKALQTTHFLPLWRIKEVLAGTADPAVATVAAAVDRVVEAEGPVRSEPVAALLQRGLRREEFAFLTDRGLVADTGVLAGDDLVLCETIIRAREAGLTDRLSTLTVLERYRQQVENLVAAEIEVFQEGIVAGAGERLAASTVEAMKVSERLVLLLRRRMLLPSFERLARPSATTIAKTSKAATVPKPTKAKKSHQATKKGTAGKTTTTTKKKKKRS
jgi:DNA-binding transcriptional MerR regulator